jgi:hypothetical protein
MTMPAFFATPDGAPIPGVLVALSLASHRSTHVSLAPLPAFYPVRPVSQEVYDLPAGQWSPVLSTEARS